MSHELRSRAQVSASLPVTRAGSATMQATWRASGTPVAPRWGASARSRPHCFARARPCGAEPPRGRPWMPKRGRPSRYFVVLRARSLVRTAAAVAGLAELGARFFDAGDLVLVRGGMWRGYPMALRLMGSGGPVFGARVRASAGRPY